MRAGAVSFTVIIGSNRHRAGRGALPHGAHRGGSLAEAQVSRFTSVILDVRRAKSQHLPVYQALRAEALADDPWSRTRAFSRALSGKAAGALASGPAHFWAAGYVAHKIGSDHRYAPTSRVCRKELLAIRMSARAKLRASQAARPLHRRHTGCASSRGVGARSAAGLHKTGNGCQVAQVTLPSQGKGQPHMVGLRPRIGPRIGVRRGRRRQVRQGHCCSPSTFRLSKFGHDGTDAFRRRVRISFSRLPD